ncbi:Rieske 2Fe-2S domain-containing protein [Nocardioides sp. BP30]|uniref:cytochrome bc1 complex Rieske iron-sulfur subunit n=1 Tax=Nocardioides sp. BP30 TaxID=3036374 RepID=UPI0024689568|nr:Rieske 2Fe-2S domain-containing protein [Nocardioides sp. BP30]WGL53793.1 Rieske 2Fe-2S domain-containing protein [Nocardioides sp. BP30]
MSDTHEIEAHTDALLPDPGHPEHHWRPTDVDPRAERRAERQVATLFGLSVVCTILFVVAYVTLQTGVGGQEIIGLGASNVALGLTLGGAFLFIGVGVIQWARKLMADVELVEERHPASSSEEDRNATLAALQAGLEESGIARRPLIRNSLLLSVSVLVAPAVVMLRDLGPLPGDKLRHTVWAKNMRVVRDVVGTPIRPADLEIGDLVNAEPEIIFGTENGQSVPSGEALEGAALQDARAKSATILLRMDPDDIVSDVTRNWSVSGIVAYSKICTHVGCPISLNERTTHHLLCPCHQSTFDLADSGKVVFGPAGRHLPQLPLGVDDEGFLVALSDYPEPVGPSFWERETKSPQAIYDEWSKETGQ